MAKKKTNYPLLILLILSGCELPHSDECNLIDCVKNDFQALIQFITTGKRPSRSKKQMAASSEKANAEIAGEMIRVIYLLEPDQVSEFADLTSALNQGASFEGIYNGLIQSARYRKMEQMTDQADPKELSRFAEEYWDLIRTLHGPHVLDSRWARPNPPPQLGEAISEPQQAQETLSNEKQAGIRQIENCFKASSQFTLRRVLGERALQLISQLKGEKTRLSQWYGEWAAKKAQSHFDFGLEQRSTQSIDFHKDWAMKANIDLLTWEVLNRLHRIVLAKEKK